LLNLEIARFAGNRCQPGDLPLALARAKQKIVRRCDPLPYRPYTFNDLIFGRPAPQPNGCAPAVYQYGKYVGQDPDPNIRAQLARDPRTGYDPY
jgi:hypothetical protein